MKHIDDYSVHDDLIESLNRPNAKEIAELWDKTQLKFIDSQISKILIYPVIDQLDSDLVDALAVQLHCDFYDKSLSLETRRQIVKTSIAWHRIKGTPAAVEMLTQTIFHESYTKEWFNYGGRAYFFRMVQDITDGTEEVTPETLARLKKAIWKGKNVRSWLELLEFICNMEDDEEKNISDILSMAALLGFADWYPYGINNLNVPTHGGGGRHSPYVCPNGIWRHDGTIWRGESWPGALYRGGIEDMAHDLLDLAALYFASDSFITRDKRFSYGLGTSMEDQAKTTDAISSIIRAAGFHDTIPYGINNSNVPTHGGGGRHSDYVQANGTWRHDGTVKHGESWPGALFRGGIEDMAHDFLNAVAVCQISDKAEATDDERNSPVVIRTTENGWQECYPYGINNPAVPIHGGGGQHSDYIRANGAWQHDGAVRRGESWPGALFRGGIEDMAHDRMAATTLYKIRDGCLVEDKHISYWTGMDFTDSTEATDGNGELDASVCYRHNGLISRDGSHFRGETYSLGALDNGKGLKRVCRDGRWRHGDTSIVRGQLYSLA